MCWIKLFERNLDFLVFSFAASLFLDLEIESVLNDISYRANEMERIFISEFNQVRDMKITSLKFDFFETIYSYNNIYYATQKEVPRDTGLALFTISSRQSSTEFHFQMTFIDSAALP